jgi:hypothetical protein
MSPERPCGIDRVAAAFACGGAKTLAIGRSTVAAESDTPETELEALVADLSATGSLVFVFGVGWLTTHMRGHVKPVFRGPAERRWWHVEHGENHSNWILDVRLDQVEAVRFVREPNPFPLFPGEESLTVRFEFRRPARAVLLPRKPL